MIRKTCFISGCFAVLLTLVTVPLLFGQAATAQPLSISEAVAIAVTRNPQILAGKANQREAAADILANRSSLFPRISAAEVFTDSTDPVFAFGARLRQGRFGTADFAPARLNSPGATTDFMTTAGATWTVFNSGRTHHQIQSSRAALQAVQQQNEAVAQRIQLLTIHAYYKALLSDQNTIVTAAAVARAQAFQRQAHDRVDAGLALLSDAIEADVELSQRKQDAAEAASNSELGYSELAAVLGNPSKRFAIIAPCGTPADMLTPLAELNAEAMKNRPDLLALRSRVEAARQNTRASRGAYGPQISSFANVQADNPRLDGGGASNWTVGAKIELQIFDGGARKADVTKAAAAIDAEGARYKSAEIEALLDVERAWFARQTASRQYAISAEMLTRTQEALRIIDDRYGAGLVTVTEVLRAQEQLLNIELDRARSLHQWWIADAQLRLATGNTDYNAKGVTP